MADGKVTIKVAVDTSDAYKSIDDTISKFEKLGKTGNSTIEKLTDLKYAFKDIETGKLTDVNKIGAQIEKTLLRMKEAMISFGSSLDMTDKAAFMNQMMPFIESTKKIEELKIWTDLYREHQNSMIEQNRILAQAEVENERWANEKKRQERESYIRWWENTLKEQENKQKEFQSILNYPTQAAKAGTPMSTTEQIAYFNDIIGAYKQGTAEYEQILNKKAELERKAATEAEQAARDEAARVEAARQEYINWWNKTLAEQDARASNLSINTDELNRIKAAINELNKQSLNMTPGNMEQTQAYTKKLADAMKTLSSSEASVVDKEKALKFLREELSNSTSRLSKVTESLTAQTRAQQKAEAQAKLLALANQKLASKTNLLGNAFRQATGYILAYLSVYRLIDVLKEAVSASSDLIEVQNVVDTTFGDAAEAIDKFAKSAIYNLGMSELSAKNFVSSFGSTLKASGITEDLGDLSIALTQLVGDFASFRNLNYEDAFQKIQSAITGETKGIRLYGVAVTDANLANYALELGITKSTKAMTENEKIMLRMSFMLRAMRDSAGDFVKTQDTWANQTRILGETWKQFLTILGDTLRITLTGALKWLVSFVQNLVMVMKYIRAFFALLSDANTKFDEYGNIISGKWAAPKYSGFADGVASDMNTIEESADSASEALQGLLASYDDVQVLSKSSVSGGTSGSNGLTADDFNLGNLMNQQSIAASQWSTDIEAPNFDITKVKEAVQWYNDHVKPIFDWILNNKDTIIGAIEAIVVGFLAFKTLQTLLGVFQSVSGFFSTLGTFFSLTGTAGIVIVVIGLIIAALVLLYLTCGDFRQAVDKAFDNLGDKFENLWETFSDVKDRFISALDNLVGAFQNAGFEIQDVWDLITLVIEAVGTYIVSYLSYTVTRVSELLSGVINIVSGVINIIAGIINKDWRMLWDGAKQILAGFIQWALSQIDGLIEAINNLLNLDIPKLGDTLSSLLLEDSSTSKASKVLAYSVDTSAIVKNSKSLMKHATQGKSNAGGLAGIPANNLYDYKSEQKTTNQLLSKLNTNIANAMNKNVTIELDGDVVGQTSVDFINGVTLRTGKNPVG